MKKTFILILAFLAVFTASCSVTPKYRNDLTCEEILKGAPLLKQSADGYDSYDKDYVDFFFEGISAEDFCILYSAEQNDINEIGVFFASDEQKKAEISSKTEKYLDEMKSSQKTFIASYAAEELPKLEGATLRVYGNYVIYAILSAQDMQELFSYVESTLEK